MRKTIGYFTAFLACFTLSTGAWAYDDYISPEAPTDPPGSVAPDDPAIPGIGTGPDEDLTSPDPLAESIRDAALKARKKALITAAATAVIALGFGTACAMTPWPANLMSCVTAILTAAASGASLAYANSSALKQAIEPLDQKLVDTPTEGNPWCVDLQTCKEDGGDGDGGGGGGDGDDRLAGPEVGKDPEVVKIEKDLKDVQEKIARGGYGLDEHGNIQTPGGSLGPVSSLTPDKLASLGISGEMQAELRKKIQDEIAQAEARMEGGSMTAGGGGNAAAAYAASARTPQQWRQANSRSPASVEGLSVRRGNDLIGVRGADIFDMVHRKYQEERKRTDFLQ